MGVLRLTTSGICQLWAQLDYAKANCSGFGTSRGLAASGLLVLCVEAQNTITPHRSTWIRMLYISFLSIHDHLGPSIYQASWSYLHVVRRLTILSIFNDNKLLSSPSNNRYSLNEASHQLFTFPFSILYLFLQPPSWLLWAHYANCGSLVARADFSVNVYDMDRKLCLNRSHVIMYDAETATVFKHKAEEPHKIVVARKQVNTGLYPGKHLRFDRFQIVVVKESTQVIDGQGDLVGPVCYWKCVLYTSPNALPVGAIKAGYDVNEDSLYVARAKVNGYYCIGYYKPIQRRGYFAK